LAFHTLGSLCHLIINFGELRDRGSVSNHVPPHHKLWEVAGQR
jgi:hypothetical protein